MGDFKLPVYSLEITFIILLLVMFLRYFILVGTAFIISKKYAAFRIEEGDVSRLSIKRDIIYSLMSTVIFSASGTLIIRLWQKGNLDIYEDAAKYGWTYFLLSPFIYMIFHDVYFYWTHRFLHLPLIFKKIHRIHHGSRIPTAWTAFSFHPVEAILQAASLPLLIIAFPVHWLILIFILTIMTCLGIINHLGYEFYPMKVRTNRPFAFLISATHHQAHHKRVDINYGLYFTWWDLCMRTEGKLRTHD